MAHLGLNVLDTWIVREWRERERLWRQEEREWRAEDMALRDEEIQMRVEQQKYHQDLYRWRLEDMEQRRLQNSRYLWSRFSELNRRDVEEKSEHLRSLSWLTGLVTGFTMTSPVEFNTPMSISTARLMPYAICTAVVPTLMTTSTIICVYLLGCILRMGKLFVSEHSEEEFLAQCRAYAYASQGNYPYQPPPAPRRTFENFWDVRCKGYWTTVFSGFFWGVSFFLALLCTMAFIKFTDQRVAISFSAVIVTSFFAWLVFQVKWGVYLRMDSNESVRSSSRVIPGDLRQEEPYRWHLRPSIRR